MQSEHPEGPSLAVIDTVKEVNRDKETRQGLQRKLTEWRRSGVSPLWFNSLSGSEDIRLVCLVQDFRKFSTQMLDEIGSVVGVRETRTVFGFDGVANLDLLLDLEMEVLPTAELSSSYLYIQVSPGKDRHVLEALRQLPQDGVVRLVWALNTFNEQTGKLFMLLLSSDDSLTAEFVTNHIQTIDGAQHVEMDEIVDWSWMAEPESIISLCEMFFQLEGADDPFDSMDFDFDEADGEGF